MRLLFHVVCGLFKLQMENLTLVLYNLKKFTKNINFLNKHKPV